MECVFQGKVIHQCQEKSDPLQRKRWENTDPLNYSNKLH